MAITGAARATVQDRVCGMPGPLLVGPRFYQLRATKWRLGFRKKMK